MPTTTRKFGRNIASVLFNSNTVCLVIVFLFKQL